MVEMMVKRAKRNVVSEPKVGNENRRDSREEEEKEEAVAAAVITEAVQTLRANFLAFFPAV